MTKEELKLIDDLFGDEELNYSIILASLLKSKEKNSYFKLFKYTTILSSILMGIDSKQFNKKLQNSTSNYIEIKVEFDEELKYENEMTVKSVSIDFNKGGRQDMTPRFTYHLPNRDCYNCSSLMGIITYWPDDVKFIEFIIKNLIEKIKEESGFTCKIF